MKKTGKKMVFIKNVGSDVFEEAYFILKGTLRPALSDSEMIREANRIVSDSLISGYFSEKKKRRLPGVLQGFILGLSLGALTVFLLLR